jgi:uncharacterized protein (TIGR03435 family)
MTRWIPVIALPILFGVQAIQSQSPPSGGTTPRFDAVSIKQCIPNVNSRQDSETISPNSLRLECRTVKSLIQEAFINGGESSPEFGSRSVVQWQSGGRGSMTTQTTTAHEPNLRLIREPVQGGPDWLDFDLYTIEAKSGRSQDPGIVAGAMLQAILEDRFKLKVHHDTSEVPVYVLTVAEGGAHFRAAAEGSCVPFALNRTSMLGSRAASPACGSFRNTGAHAIEAFATIANFCAQLSVWLDRDVVDKTGLSGMFDFHLPFSASDIKPGPLTDPAQQISSAAQTLGLKLEPGKNPSDVLVVDHVERPAEN